MEKLHIGDVILYHSVGEDDAKFDGKYGKVMFFEPDDKVFIRFDFNDGLSHDVNIPEDLFDNPQKYCEVVYHGELDIVFNQFADGEVDDWIEKERAMTNEYDRGISPVEGVELDEKNKVVKDAEDKFTVGIRKLVKEAEQIVNCTYESVEDLAEDIFGNRTAERLRALREKYKIPAPEKEVVEMIENEDKDNENA